MKSICLYQIPFSHFCDKVRWALDYYSIPYEPINYVGPRTRGLEKIPRKLQKLTPIIEDPNNDSLFISDSTPILVYLDNHYGNKKTLFPSNTTDEKDHIIQYCLRLDSQLGLYARRLAYLYVISEKPAILSVFVDGDFNKVSCDDWKSYFQGLLSSCFIIARFGLHQIQEEKIFEKTICLLEEIKQNINGKEYLFNNQFTAADLTLTSLMEPLRLVPSLFIKYKTIFDYCDRIRERHDPKKREESLPARLLKEHRQQRQSLEQQQSTIRNIILYIFYILFYPLHLLFTMNNNKKKKPVLQYPSNSINEKADNDVRVLKLESKIKIPIFFIKYFYHLCFTLPKQMQFINNQGKKLLNK